MRFPFEWNEFADQPHNIAPRRERLRHHLRRADVYIGLLGLNLARVAPILMKYFRLKRSLYHKEVRIVRGAGISVSPVEEREDEVIRLLLETGARDTLVRIPSWEGAKMGRYAAFLERLRKSGVEPVVALLQRRDDVLSPSGWRDFLEEAFSACGRSASHFEIGHAWNRTKWGVWDHREYLELAAPAFRLAAKKGIKLVGPAVIDFEFHLYPPTLAVLPFDKVSSLLYVDRVGRPENAQAGWTAAMKTALLKATIDVCSRKGKDCWVTEVNWPLEGMEKYSPASGRPNVSEEEQADYLVRYYVICLATGLVERIYWWQLAAPGYGLVDNLSSAWRRRPSYFALKTMVEHLEGSLYVKRMGIPPAHVFHFIKGGKHFAVCWSSGRPVPYRFPRAVERVVGRDGREIAASAKTETILEGRPKYVTFR